MRNRAKCKKCLAIVESFHAQDLCVCDCGAIGVDGGESMRCLAKDWNDFWRLDEEGKTIDVKICDSNEDTNNISASESSRPNKKELIEMLGEQIKAIENMPAQAMHGFCTHSDMCSLMLLLLAIFKSED